MAIREVETVTELVPILDQHIRYLFEPGYYDLALEILNLFISPEKDGTFEEVCCQRLDLDRLMVNSNHDMKDVLRVWVELHDLNILTYHEETLKVTPSYRWIHGAMEHLLDDVQVSQPVLPGHMLTPAIFMDAIPSSANMSEPLEKRRERWEIALIEANSNLGIPWL